MTENIDNQELQNTEISNAQIRAMGIIAEHAQTLYGGCFSELEKIYFTQLEYISEWADISSDKKIEKIQKFMEDMRGRWSHDLARRFCPAYLNESIARRVINKIIDLGIKEGAVSSEDARREFLYRSSLGSFLLSETFVQAHDRRGFILYDAERRLYYPGPEGRSMLARIAGHASLEQHAGVHGLSREQRIEISSKAGKIGGRRTYDMRTGFFNRTPEQKTQDRKKAWATQGLEVWSDEELAFVKEEYSKTDNLYPEGHNHAGMANWYLITQKFNAHFQIKRTAKALRIIASRIKLPKRIEQNPNLSS